MILNTIKSQILILSVCIALISCTTLTSHKEDFKKDSRTYNENKVIVEGINWESLNNGDLFKVNNKGLLLPAEGWSSINYKQAISTVKPGDAISVSIDFTYDQVCDQKEKEILRIGATNGESSIMACFHRKGWGDYHSIGMEGYPVGVVFYTGDIGFERNLSTGTSDPLRFSMSLTRGNDNVWDLVVILENLNTDFIKRWDKEGLKFKEGSNDKLYAVIQNGASDNAAGISKRLITKFECSNKQASPPPPKTWNGVNFKDYVLPIQPKAPLATEGTWGENIFPRDTTNGLEDTDLSHWCYWDGSIVKDDSGKYHMYASRWGQEFKHSEGWKINSKGVHAVSEDILGPYKDIGMTWPQWNNGKGSNVIGLRTFEGKYALVTSEITKGEVFISDNPSGPFKFLGEIKVDYNGFNPGLAAYYGGKGNMSNVMIIPRHDGRYMIVPRSTAILISDNGILGPYKIMSGRIYEDMPEIPKTRMEDPTAWYSGGMYHMLVNHWPGKTTYHFSSIDGITEWKYRGIAYRKDESIFRYTDGTVDEWIIVQRPTAYTENGHITHFNFSVMDVTKNSDIGNDNHGSKIIVVPFDGEAFDKNMQAIVKAEEK